MTASCPTDGQGRQAGAPSEFGLVTRAYSNFCEVLYQGETIRCQFMGRLKLAGPRLLTGDRVTVTIQRPGIGMVTGILPRRSELTRPPIANVDLCCVVLSTQSPPLNPELVDKLLILAQRAGLDVLLCINKSDLTTVAEVEAARQVYAATGWQVVVTSAKQGVNLDEFVAALGGRTAVLAGQSGVGKSTLLNAVRPDLNLQTGELSVKVQRGKHTTRAVQLLRIGAGWVADTPGFVQVELPVIEPVRLQDYYPEFGTYAGQCRFPDCVHIPEPGCSVKAALQAGKIDRGRYDRYVNFMDELEKRPSY